MQDSRFFVQKPFAEAPLRFYEHPLQRAEVPREFCKHALQRAEAVRCGLEWRFEKGAICFWVTV